nr:hypothetical protein GZ11A10_34 [uncultured archaeon GZfos11A10]
MTRATTTRPEYAIYNLCAGLPGGEVRHKNHAQADIYPFTHKTCGCETFPGVLPVLPALSLTISRPARSPQDQKRVVGCDLPVPICVSGGIVLWLPAAISIATIASAEVRHCRC